MPRLPELKAVCAVSPTMDLAVCVEALERRSNLAYQWNFVRRLKARMRRKAAVVPGVFTLEPLRRIWTVRQFDEAYTAPHHGFRDAADYYHRASAMRVVDRIRVPALILTAEDDPFVPVEPFQHPAVTGNPRVTTIVTRHGGHCAFVEHATRMTTTATGRRRKSSGSSRLTQMVHQHPRELRPLPFLFVLEVDEDLAAA